MRWNIRVEHVESKDRYFSHNCPLQRRRLGNPASLKFILSEKKCVLKFNSDGPTEPLLCNYQIYGHANHTEVGAHEQIKKIHFSDRAMCNINFYPNKNKLYILQNFRTQIFDRLARWNERHLEMCNLVVGRFHFPRSLK